MKRNVKAAIEKERQKAGLDVYNGPLTAALCSKCHRVFFWRVVPKTCPWPNCGGELS